MYDKDEVRPDSMYSDQSGDGRIDSYDHEGGSHSSRRTGKPNVHRGGGGDKRKFFLKKRICFFCKNKEAILDYKEVNLMKRFVAESGKIVPRRFSGTCAKHQRKLSTEIKKARQMALIPYTVR